MQVNDQLHASVALVPVKGPPVSAGYETEWVPEPVWTLEKIKSPALSPVTNWQTCTGFSSHCRHDSANVAFRSGCN
jgi:hypothetical protein